MAAALGGWLKEVIVVVMLATLVDLLLPGQAMRGYARTVLGLVVLFALLAPLFRLLSSGWDERVLLRPLAERPAGGPSAGAAAIPPLQAIVRDGERLAEWRNDEARRLAEERAAEAVRRRIVELYPDADVVSVVVGTKPDREGGIVPVRVGIEWRYRDLPPKDAGGLSRTTRIEVSPVPAVAPVEPAGGRSRIGPLPQAEPTADERTRRSAAIADSVARYLEIPVSGVEVRYAGERSATVPSGR